MSIALIENFYLQCLWNFDFQFRNQSFVRFAIFTRISMTGTSVRTPTVVANAAGDDVPNMFQTMLRQPQQPAQKN